MFHVRRPRKLLAGVGLLSVLLGASLVAAPSATAHHAPVTSTTPAPTVVEGNATCPPGTVEFKFDSPFDIEGDSDTRDLVLPGDTESTSVTISYEGYSVEGVRHYDWTSSESVTTVIVKQANSSAIFTYPAGTESGTAYVALYSGQTASTDGTSHVSFCLDGYTPPPPATGSIAVEKVVTGTGIPDPVPTFPVTVACLDDEEPVDLTPGDDATTSASLELVAGADAVVFDDLPVGTECTVTETDTKGAVVSYTVEGADGNVATVVADTVQDVVVTNTYSETPATGSVSVQKVVTGTGIPDPVPTFPVTVACAADEVPVDLTPGDDATTSASLDLVAGADAVVFDDLPAGATCTVTETDAKGAVVGYAVEGAAGNVVTVVAGAVQEVVVTNTYTAPPSVLPTPPVTPVQPQVQPQNQVLGSVVSRQLPRTGSGTAGLALVGLGLLALGAALVRSGDKHLRRVS